MHDPCKGRSSYRPVGMTETGVSERKSERKNSLDRTCDFKPCLVCTVRRSGSIQSLTRASLSVYLSHSLLFSSLSLSLSYFLLNHFLLLLHTHSPSPSFSLSSSHASSACTVCSLSPTLISSSALPKHQALWHACTPLKVDYTRITPYICLFNTEFLLLRVLTRFGILENVCWFRIKKDENS